MLKTKRNLEKLENFADRTVKTQPPDPQMIADLKVWITEAKERLANKIATKQENSSPVVRVPDENKSEARRELDTMIRTIAERMHPSQPKPTVPLTINFECAPETHSNGDTIEELHELLRDLRKRLGGKQ